MNRLQAAVVDGTHVERSRRTLGAYLEDWLAARNDIRANTTRDYSVSIHNHIGPRLGDVPLQAVDRLRIRGLYRQLAESGLVEKTEHNVHVCLRKALQDAVDDGLLRRNPAERAHAMPKDRPEMRTWSADELATFLAFVAQDRELALYHVAAATGMRRGELLGLRWRDVDLAGARLSVRQQYTRQGKSLGFGPPKSAKSIRTIDLDGETVVDARPALALFGYHLAVVRKLALDETHEQLDPGALDAREVAGDRERDIAARVLEQPLGLDETFPR